MTSLLWPDFLDRWILYEDDDLIVVDKPVGMETHAGDPKRSDDLLTRLHAHLTQREGREVYLGVHQRLDRETSGVLLLTKSREVNPQVAAQFEGRQVTKTYLAAVTGWKALHKRTTLRHTLLWGGDRSRVVRAGGGEIAITQVSLHAQQADRSLLTLTLETGRTHQARVQLAQVGCPVAGDPLYGGPAAPRLLLHACSLSLRHPRTGKRLTFQSTSPREFATWLAHGDLGPAVYDDPDALHRALDRALARRFVLGRSVETAQPTTAFRVVHEGGDGLPGLAVDVYNQHLVVQVQGREGVWADPARLERVLDALHARGFAGIYLKVRPKHASVLREADRLANAPRAPVRGVAAPEEFVVQEEGVAFAVRLGDGLSTGLFLDGRENRVRLRALAAGKSLLNLFAYTGGFSVAAALGGARRTVTVDVSASAIARAQAQFAAHNLMERGAHQFVQEDARAWLARAVRKEERFDLIVLDPPSYATTKQGPFSAEHHYVELAATALTLLKPGGRLLACTNHRGIRQGKFRRFLHQAVEQAGKVLAQMKDLPTPFDHPPAAGEESPLKSILLTLAQGGSPSAGASPRRASGVQGPAHPVASRPSPVVSRQPPRAARRDRPNFPLPREAPTRGPRPAGRPGQRLPREALTRGPRPAGRPGQRPARPRRRSG